MGGQFRFSLNSSYVIDNFEPGTSSLAQRIEAARKVAKAQYPLGFILAPLYRHDGWQEGYLQLFEQLEASLPTYATKDLTFELIQHRFTKKAKSVIMKRYPKTKLRMDEEERKYKWGKYGIGKYIYQDDEANELKETIENYVKKFFPQAKIAYFT